MKVQYHIQYAVISEYHNSVKLRDKYNTQKRGIYSMHIYFPIHDSHEIKLSYIFLYPHLLK